MIIFIPPPEKTKINFRDILLLIIFLILFVYFNNWLAQHREIEKIMSTNVDGILIDYITFFKNLDPYYGEYLVRTSILEPIMINPYLEDNYKLQFLVDEYNYYSSLLEYEKALLKEEFLITLFKLIVNLSLGGIFLYFMRL